MGRQNMKGICLCMCQGRYTLYSNPWYITHDIANTAGLFADLPKLLANTNPTTTIPLDLTSTTDRVDIAVVFLDIVRSNHEKAFQAARTRKMSTSCSVKIYSS